MVLENSKFNNESFDVRNTFVHINGIGEITEQNIWSHGFHSWYSFLIKHPGGYERFIHNITDSINAFERCDFGYFLNRLPSNQWWRIIPNILDKAIYFDIETTELDINNDEIVIIAALHDGKVEHLIKYKNLTRENVQKLFSKSNIIVSFNGKSFDVPFIQNEFDISLSDKHHLDLIHLSRSCGLKGGLKAIEKKLEIERLLPEIDGSHFPRFWNEFKHSNDETLFDIMLTYAVEDIVHLPHFMIRLFNSKLEKVHFPIKTRLLENVTVNNPIVERSLIKLKKTYSNVDGLLLDWKTYLVKKKFKNERLEVDNEISLDIALEETASKISHPSGSIASLHDLKMIVRTRDNNRCIIPECNDSGNLEVHHIIPVSRGGSDSLDNLVTLCRKHHAKQHPFLAGLFLGEVSTDESHFWDMLNRKIRNYLDLTDKYGPYLNFLTEGEGTELREGQKEILDSILNGENVLVIRPTGSGKSVTFQIPALMNNGTAIVITPLKALMVDQVYKLRRVGIPAIYINSDMGKTERNNVLELAIKGAFKFIYVAPERFFVNDQNEIALLKKIKVNMIVIDEAHVRDVWCSFRPSYFDLKKICNFLGSPQVLAFTATADTKIANLLHDELALSKTFAQGFDRPNIYLDINQIDGENEEVIFNKKMKIIVAHLNNNPSNKKVVFVPTITKCKQVFDFLPSNLQSCTRLFHSELSTMEREDVLMKFAGRRPGIINNVIATKAFGMGLDIPNIRDVIHFSPSTSILDYVQEIGRAGRDGFPSSSVLLFSNDDEGLLSYMINKSTESLKEELKKKNTNEIEIQSVIADEFSKKSRYLDEMFEYCRNFNNSCLRKYLENYFKINARNTKGEKRSVFVRILKWFWLKFVEPTSIKKENEISKKSCCIYCSSKRSSGIQH